MAKVDKGEITVNLGYSRIHEPAVELAALRHEWGHLWLDKATKGVSTRMYNSSDNFMYPFLEEIAVDTYATGSLTKVLLNAMNHPTANGAGGVLFHLNKKLQVTSSLLGFADPIVKGGEQCR